MLSKIRSHDAPCKSLGIWFFWRYFVTMMTFLSWRYWMVDIFFLHLTYKNFQKYQMLQDAITLLYEYAACTGLGLLSTIMFYEVQIWTNINNCFLSSALTSQELRMSKLVWVMSEKYVHKMCPISKLLFPNEHNHFALKS